MTYLSIKYINNSLDAINIEEEGDVNLTIFKVR